jgi:three-Cys-motif partner protein
MPKQIPFWPDGVLPPQRRPEPDFKSLRYPVWTRNKARLIQEYLRLFEFITHHGAYIDGFAAPQYGAHSEDSWAAKLVLETEPKWFKDFWLCDLSPLGIERLRELSSVHQGGGRKIEVVPGDFNETIYSILSSGRITDKKATFALLDQRTFECEWQTVEAISRHKETTKIEQFYFFATGWIDRSIGAVRAAETAEKVKRWWGRDDWKSLLGMNGTSRALLVAKRFQDELGYNWAKPYPIHSERTGSRVMYHMIHATDHDEATKLMVRAYRKVSGRSDLGNESQSDFEDLWSRLAKDED